MLASTKMHASRSSTLLIVWWLAACAGFASPGSRGLSVDGSYSGRFVVDGQHFAATLDLRVRSGGVVGGFFSVTAPVELEGRVEGALVDDLLRLAIRYANPEGCAGEIEGVLEITLGGELLEGPVAVEDCGQPVAGQMSFQRTRSP